jgi:3-hydroxyisobutyrate dehydrogenase
MQSVAILGLGTMGSGMARRLLGAGFPLTIYNRTRARADALAAEGAAVADTPRAAAGRAEVIIAMLADDAASRSVWLGDDGALAGSRPGSVLIESSTLSVPWVFELSAAANGRRCGFLDAPVTGSKPQAESGGLLFLAGGDAEVLDGVRPVLAAMSRAVAHMGPNGCGALMKLVNNFLCAVQAASLAEAMTVIEHSPLDRARALEILKEGAPGSPMLRTLSARMVSQDYRPNFALALMAKDLSYAIAEGRRLGVALETAQSALRLFQNANQRGYGDKDLAAVVEPLRS